MTAPASHPKPPTGRRWLRMIVPVAAVVVLLVVFPPFRFVKLDAAGKRIASGPAAAAAFDPTAFATAVWEEQLPPAAAHAQPVEAILALLAKDPKAAAGRFGREAGVGSTAIYFARGTGRVVEVNSSEVVVEVDDSGGMRLSLRTGPVFGNVLRDGCGLLELNAFPGLAEFNALSAELNRLVEERVQPDLKAGAALDRRVTFVGCAEAPESLEEGKPALRMVPVAITFLP